MKKLVPPWTQTAYRHFRLVPLQSEVAQVKGQHKVLKAPLVFCEVILG